MNISAPSPAPSAFSSEHRKKTLILVFTQKKALKSFRESNGWKAGVDGSVALITVGIGGSIDTTNIKDPIVAFAFDQKGLMYNSDHRGFQVFQNKKVDD